MKRTLVSILAMATLAASAQDQPSSAPPKSDYQQCVLAMWAHPSMAPVVARVVTRSPEDAIKLRTSTAKASAKEKPAIGFWLSEVEKCNQLSLQRMADWDAEARTTVRSHQLEENKALADLYSGAITWGGFMEANITRSERFQAKAAEYDERQKQAQHRWEMEQKRQADAQKALQDAQAQARYEAAVAGRERDLQAIRQREQEAKNRSQQQFNEGLQMLIQANQPRPPPPQIAPTIRCSSQTHWGVTNTTCN